MAATQQLVESLRAEALATVFLTRTGELDVIPVSPSGQGGGYDLLIRLADEEQVAGPLFAVEIERTKNGLRSDRSGRKLDLKGVSLEFLDLPLLFLLVDSVREEGYFGWLVEPVVDPNGNAELRVRKDWFLDKRGSVRPQQKDLAKLDNEAVRRLTQEVLAWRAARHDATPLVIANGDRERRT